MDFRRILQWPLYQRQQRLAESRIALSKAAFVEQLAHTDVSRAEVPRTLVPHPTHRPVKPT